MNTPNKRIYVRPTLSPRGRLSSVTALEVVSGEGKENPE
jgi:hypothetical protein